jgi:hypothetical protein
MSASRPIAAPDQRGGELKGIGCTEGMDPEQAFGADRPDEPVSRHHLYLSGFSIVMVSGGRHFAPLASLGGDMTVQTTKSAGPGRLAWLSVCTLATMSLLAAGGRGVEAQGAKSNVSIDVVASFGAGGQIGGDSDDGSGTYRHRETGNRCQIESGTGDFMFQLDLYSHKGARRTAYVDLNSPADGASAPFGRHQGSSFFLTVDRLYQMQVGETKLTTGAVRFKHADGQLYWIRFNGQVGSLLEAERLSPDTWRVSTIPDGVGELTILNDKGKISYTHIGTYYLSYSVVIAM